MAYTFNRNSGRKTLQMELLFESNLSSPLATLSALQRFDFFWSPAAMETR